MTRLYLTKTDASRNCKHSKSLIVKHSSKFRSASSSPQVSVHKFESASFGPQISVRKFGSAKCAIPISVIFVLFYEKSSPPINPISTTDLSIFILSFPMGALMSTIIIFRPFELKKQTYDRPINSAK